MQEREIRAIYDDSIIRVYQAYSPAIAKPALEAGRFVPPFKLSRMTWIKPSFCWMMYRSGYASKPGQEMVLGIDITREGFEWALEHSVVSTFKEHLHDNHNDWKQGISNSPVRIQWDPERDPSLKKIEGVRSIQIGLTGKAIEHYVNEWIVGIEDVTPVVRSSNKVITSGGIISQPFPNTSERVYPINSMISEIIHASATKPSVS